MKSTTAFNKRIARHYCDVLNRVVWKIPIKPDWIETREKCNELFHRIASEAGERLQMADNPHANRYSIVWDESKEEFKPVARK